MSYLVLARKWRPLTFADVVGQEHITATLRKAIEKNRVAHAYIFAGTRGVGKTTTARILARALNCEKGPTAEPCGACDSCKGVAAGSSFDVLEIDGASNNSVDDVRQLRENVAYSSMGGKYRIYVIDEVHMLSKPAFNALLKTLEEPPPNVIFIFATTEPHKIPATIHSRCQRYDFRRIMPELILARLEHICGLEKIAYEKGALMLIARKAEGSMRDALSLLDQAFSYCPEKLTEKEVRQVLGLVGMEVYESLMNAAASQTPSAALAVVQEVLYQGFDLHEFVLGLEEHLRSLLFSKIEGALERAGLGLESGVVESFRRSAARFSEGDLLRMQEIVHRTENALRWSALPRFAVEIMLLKLVYLDRTLQIERLLAELGGSGETAVAGVADQKKKDDAALTPAACPESQSIPAAAPVDRGGRDTAGIRGRWPAFIESLMRDRPHIGTFLSLAAVEGSSESSIDLSFPETLKVQFSEVSKKQHRDEIQKALDTFAGRPVALHITLEPKKAETRAPKYIQQEPRPVSIESEMEREPVIGSVLSIFDGEIIT